MDKRPLGCHPRPGPHGLANCSPGLLHTPCLKCLCTSPLNRPHRSVQDSQRIKWPAQKQLPSMFSLRICSAAAPVSVKGGLAFPLYRAFCLRGPVGWTPPRGLSAGRAASLLSPVCYRALSCALCSSASSWQVSSSSLGGPLSLLSCFLALFLPAFLSH